MFTRFEEETPVGAQLNPHCASVGRDHSAALTC